MKFIRVIFSKSFDFINLSFIKNFNLEVKPKIIELFDKYNSNVIIFHSHKQADDYIVEISKNTSFDITLKNGELK